MQINTAGKHPVWSPSWFTWVDWVGKNIVSLRTVISILPLGLDSNLANYQMQKFQSKRNQASAVTYWPWVYRVRCNCLQCFLTMEGMKIDLGALAKGYIADKIAAFLRGVTCGSLLPSLGGNILTIGLMKIIVAMAGNSKLHLATCFNLARISLLWLQEYMEKETAVPMAGSIIIFFDRTTGYPINNQLAS